ncbi:MAG: hypothetical protein AAB965_03985 [Patescibacteria group bacterium]
MNKKIFSFAILVSALPMLALAVEQPGPVLKGRAVEIDRKMERLEERKADIASSTGVRAAERATKKAAMDEKRQAEVKKLLDRTMENYNKLLTQVEDLAKRTATREGIMFDKGTLSPQEKAAVDAKLLIATDMIAKVRVEISNLANLSNTLVASDKPGQEVKALRKASNKVKDDIKAVHKAVVQAISLIKSSSDKERRTSTSTPEKRSDDNRE